MHSGANDLGMRGASLGRSRARWIAMLLVYGLVGLGYTAYYLCMTKGGARTAEGREDATVS